VSNVATTGRPRVALDVSEDTLFLRNPDLPDTRSEMALPLAVGEKIIGVLDVQSTEANAFAEEDVEVLVTLANQVAIAMENARLFRETREALKDVENAYRGFLRQEWSGFARQLELVGVHRDGRVIESIFSDGTIRDEPQDAGLVVPITLHGDVVGELTFGAARPERSWSEDELAVFRATADRVAVALENARLMIAARRRAERERLIGEISAKITATSDLENVIQTAVEELGRSLPDAEVSIQFQGEAG
jgi:GAF domain-containing protein